MTLLAVASAALIAPILPYDAWWYHLPFAARLWHIPGAAGFGLDPMLIGRWEGFPKAWHWLMGLAWSASGSLRMVALPQTLLLAAFLAMMWKRFGLSPALVALGLFASPMLFIHAQATYLDLPAPCVGRLVSSPSSS